MTDADSVLAAFKACCKDDANYRSSKELDNTVALLEYYDNRAEDRTRRVNKALGVGLTDVEHRPLQVGLLRYAIDRQAVVYARPPTRWLRSAGDSRLAPDDPQHVLMRRIYQAARVDLTMRLVDRLANLLQVVALRVYALRDRIEVRLFTPDLVRRSPDSTVQTELARDSAFALKTSNDEWEFWQRLSPLDAEPADEQWQMSVVQWRGEDGNGNAVLTAPTPMPRPPAMLIYEQLGYQAWPDTRSYRIAATETINAMANDLWAGVRADTHNTRVWLGVAADEVPTTRGHGKEIAIEKPPSQVAVQDLAPRPQIDSSVGVQDKTVAMYLVSEDLPPDDLDKAKTVVTGAALRTRLFGLIERRAAQAQMAPENEATLFGLVRFQWNRLGLLRAAKGLPPLPTLDESLAMEIELAPIDLPTDSNIQVQANEKEVALGVKSRLEVAMEQRGISRAAAAQALEQIATDEKAFLKARPEIAAAAAEAKTPTQQQVPNDGPGAKQ